MKVTDLNGFEIEIKDLDEAIRQSAGFTAYSHECGKYNDFDKERHAYWSDMLHKLLELKNNCHE